MEYLRIVAKVIKGICDKNGPFREQYTEMAEGLLDGPTTMKQKEPVIEPVGLGFLTKKTAYAATVAKEVDHRRELSHWRLVRERKPSRRLRASRYWLGGAQGPVRLGDRHEGGEAHLISTHQ